MMRFLRLFRILRVIRIVRFIQELNNILYLICGSLWAFFWTFSLLFLLSYVTGALFTQGVADARADNHFGVAHDDKLEEHFGTVMASIFSMYKAILGGIDWGELTSPLQDAKIWWTQPVFMMYIAFAALVMLNLVTGVFVDGARKLSQRDVKVDLLKRLEKILHQACIPEDGYISRSDFMDQMDNPDMVALFDAIGVSMEQEGHILFNLLDTSNRGKVTPEAFVLGGLRLQGAAQAFDLAKLVHTSVVGFAELSDRLDKLILAQQALLDGEWSKNEGLE